MFLNKWNYKKHKYEPYEVPDNWDVAEIKSDMDATCNCASCGRQIKFGDSYSSNIFHILLGLSCAVCGECYEKEMKERFKHEPN